MKYLFLIPFVCFAQYERDSTFVELTFSEQMRAEELHLTENYEIIGNSGDALEVYLIGDVEDTDSVVVIFAGKMSYESQYYTVYTSNLFDLAGNEINYEKNFAHYTFGAQGLITPPDDVDIRKLE